MIKKPKQTKTKKCRMMMNKYQKIIKKVKKINRQVIIIIKQVIINKKINKLYHLI